MWYACAKVSATDVSEAGPLGRLDLRIVLDRDGSFRQRDRCVGVIVLPAVGGPSRFDQIRSRGHVIQRESPPFIAGFFLIAHSGQPVLVARDCPAVPPPLVPAAADEGAAVGRDESDVLA